MGKRRNVGMRIDHPSDSFGRPGQLVKTAIREMASTDMQGECERRNIDIGD